MADLTIYINEKITLDGTERGVLTTQTITGINNIDNRIMTCPSGSTTTIFTVSDTPTSAGSFATSSIQYARVTNKSIVPIQLSIASSNQNFWFTVNTGNSFLVSTKASGSNSTDFILPNITNVSITPSGSSATIEYFIATT
jgi:hypothetical protein